MILLNSDAMNAVSSLIAGWTKGELFKKKKALQMVFGYATSAPKSFTHYAFSWNSIYDGNFSSQLNKIAFYYLCGVFPTAHNLGHCK